MFTEQSEDLYQLEPASGWLACVVICFLSLILLCNARINISRWWNFHAIQIIKTYIWKVFMYGSSKITQKKWKQIYIGESMSFKGKTEPHCAPDKGWQKFMWFQIHLGAMPWSDDDHVPQKPCPPCLECSSYFQGCFSKEPGITTNSTKYPYSIKIKIVISPSWNSTRKFWDFEFSARLSRVLS